MKLGSKVDKEKYKKLTKELLESLYVHQNLSTNDIQKLLDVNRATITTYMKKYGIERRLCGQSGAAKVIKHNTLDENYFNVIDSEHKAYMLGFILGDGCLTSKGVHIALAIEDYQILYDMAKRMNAEKYISITKSKNINEQDKVHLPLRRKLFAVDLNNHGIPYPPKSLNENFITLSNELQWHFIRGMFDADGCIRVYERDKLVKYKLSITAGESFCVGFKQFLEKFFNTSLPLKSAHKKSDSNVWVFEVASKNIIQNIANYMYKDASIFLERKKIKFDKLGE